MRETENESGAVLAEDLTEKAVMSFRDTSLVDSEGSPFAWRLGWFLRESTRSGDVLSVYGGNPPIPLAVSRFAVESGRGLDLAHPFDEGLENPDRRGWCEG